MQYVIQVIIMCTCKGFCNSRSEPCEIKVSKVADWRRCGWYIWSTKPRKGVSKAGYSIIFLYASMFYELVLLGKSITQYDAYLLLRVLFWSAMFTNLFDCLYEGNVVIWPNLVRKIFPIGFSFWIWKLKYEWMSQLKYTLLLKFWMKCVSGRGKWSQCLKLWL